VEGNQLIFILDVFFLSFYSSVSMKENRNYAFHYAPYSHNYTCVLVHHIVWWWGCMHIIMCNKCIICCACYGRIIVLLNSIHDMHNIVINSVFHFTFCFERIEKKIYIKLRKSLASVPVALRKKGFILLLRILFFVKSISLLVHLTYRHISQLPRWCREGEQWHHHQSYLYDLIW